MKLQKRLFDLFWTIPGLLILAPFFIIIALLIKLDDGGPVFFTQERVGKGGRVFRMWKFRTMVVDAEKRGSQLTIGRDPRVTRVGYWLRKFKVDELPQLFNVLIGDMSLVGPRPEIPWRIKFFTSEQQKILDLVPGITGPASILYRNESELLALYSDPEQAYLNEIMPEKIRINLAYAQKATIWSDFWIILQTFWKILKSDCL